MTVFWRPTLLPKKDTILQISIYKKKSKIRNASGTLTVACREFKSYKSSKLFITLSITRAI
jgi:hypothetical protein